MLTYQDFEKAADKPTFIALAINRHLVSEQCRTARDADLYNAQRNVTINRLTRIIAERAAGGDAQRESDTRLASNFFKRFNRQRCSYLLGNGVSFTQKEKRVNEQGILYNADVTKERLGEDFDTQLYRWTYKALIHGVSFGYWNWEKLYVFPITNFVPLWDENTGALRAGIRFWRLDSQKPMTAELYTEEGVITYRSKENGASMVFQAVDDAPRPYLEKIMGTEAGGDVVVGAENYDTLPIIPMYGCDERQSTLIGFREKIDSFDMIQSGFANDLNDCAQIYWLIQNCGGMNDADIRKFLSDIREKHVAKVDTTSFTGDARNALSPYTQEVPYNARSVYLETLKKSMYEDFGALDVHEIAAGSTNDHIDAAYQPLDEEADQLELQVIDAVQRLLALMGIVDTPQFKRNRISNLKESIEAVMLESNLLDSETMLELLPNITVDMKEAILQRREIEDAGRLTLEKTVQPDSIEPDEGDVE